MKKSNVLAALVLAASTAFAGSALAQRAAEAGFYAGVSVGRAEARDWCSIDGAPAGFALGACDDRDTAWKLFAGYQFNRNFALEATYMDLGDYSATVSAFGTPVGINADATSWGIAAVGLLPLDQQFSLFGKLGVARTEARADVTIAGQRMRLGEDETEAHYGLGLMWNLDRNLGLRAEWERLDRSRIDTLSIGVQFKF
jgi:OmpA-OmpF porin, OOP family